MFFHHNHLLALQTFDFYNVGELDHFIEIIVNNKADGFIF